jgi:NAD(P)H-hydrate repair Nnr-like enzyme with NAD(P)H-hydrate dehydratase domain
VGTVQSLRGVFNPTILNHRARACRAALLAAWMHRRAGMPI